MEQADTKTAEMSGASTAVAFVIALGTFGALFLLLDYALMSAQGLTLFFHG